MRRSASLLLPALLSVAGCAGLSNLARERQSSTPAPVNAELVQATSLAAHINAIQTVIQGSPTEQAEILSTARAGYEQSRQGAALLHYALLLAAPTHTARDAPQAQRLLREALARPELLTAAERALAVIELQRVDSELRLAVENERLVGEVQRERERQRSNANSAQLARRLQTETEENARLRKELAEARAKLDAIATIERNISDRPPANEGRTQ
jgi:cell division septum initiation protein DivIVA